MCDTYVVLPDVAKTGTTVLGKNSDRPAFDCQPMAYHGRKKHKKEDKLNLAYLSIDQVEESYATMGSSPYWCWGYEEGINEYGVAIGNEAIYTKDLTENTELEKMGTPVKKGLLGMEILRLGLERAKTAKEALDVMAKLVEKHGQWGSGVPMSDTIDGSYNNSFIIADCNEAYVFEAAGTKWAAKKIEKGYAAISNEVSIRTDYTHGSKDLIDHAIQKGWWSEKKRNCFDFGAAYINRNNARQVSHIRVQRIRQLLKQAVSENGQISLEWMKRILRDHYEDTFLEGPYFNASEPDFLTVCMHNSIPGFTWGNTASSSLMVLPKDDDHLNVMWWAPVVPCCSLYLPLFMESGKLPECLTKAGTYGKTMTAPSEVDWEDTYKEGSFWWEIRSLLDRINGDDIGSTYEERHAIVAALFKELEERWFLEIKEVEKNAIALRNEGKDNEMAALLYAFTDQCTKEALQAISKANKMFDLMEQEEE